MSPAHVLEPTFQSLKRMLMEGAWPPGEKLEALQLADEFGVSMTPVRDCLNRLVGERLVDMKPGEGYRVPRISEKTWRDMLDLNVALLDFALSSQKVIDKSQWTGIADRNYSYRIASFFNVLMSLSRNMEAAESVRALSDRMHVIRRNEPKLFPDTEQEIYELQRSAAKDQPDLRAKLKDYHIRRQDNASALIQLAQ